LFLKFKLAYLVYVQESLAAHQLDLTVLFPQIRHGVTVQHRIQAEIGTQQWHVTVEGRENGRDIVKLHHGYLVGSYVSKQFSIEIGN
jgi:hypothetical protein